MKTLVLAGSGEFTASMVETDSYLINKLKIKNQKSKIKVAVIPTASVPDGKQQKWLDTGTEHFEKLGVRVLGVNIKNKKEADKEINLKKLVTADFIYFSGGHPGYLLDTFRDTKAWKLILELYIRGVVLAGSSAGAMIMGNYLLANAQESFDKGIKPKWVKGFGMIPYTLFPHFDWVKRKKPELFKRVLASAPNFIQNSWMGIDEDTGLIITNGKKTKVRGKGTVTVNSNSKSLVYKSGQEFLFK